MMSGPSTCSDPSWLDLENMTPDRWRSLVYNRILQQRDVFVADFKNKVINDINECLASMKLDEVLKKLHCDLLNKINKEQFESEYHTFVDGIVTATFEFVCQFIIKNSLDNIKRTQSALSSLSLSNFNNDGVNKECCNANMNKPGSFNCLFESNNNTSDLSKIIFSHLFNNSSRNKFHSLDIIAKETNKNTIINKKETITFHKHVQSRSNQDLPIELATTTELNIENNYINTAQSSLNVNDKGNDLKSTEALMSLAMKISEQELHFNDNNFEKKNISNETVGAEFHASSSLVIQNEISNDVYNEEDPNIFNGLKILEGLVNIEHDKLAVQKCLTTEEKFLLPNTSSNEKIQGKMSDTTNVKKNKRRRSKDKVHLLSIKEDTSTNKKQKKQDSESENENKSKKMKKREHKKFKKSEKVSRLQNDIDNLTLINSNSDKAVQSDQNNVLTENVTICSNMIKIKDGITNSKDVQISDTSVKSPLASQSTKDNESSKELQIQKYTTENSKLNEKEYTVSANDCNTLPMKTNLTATTTHFNDKNMENIKIKSSTNSKLNEKEYTVSANDCNTLPMKTNLTATTTHFTDKNMENIKIKSSTNSKLNEKEYTVSANDCNTLPMKTNLTATTTHFTDKNMENIKIKSSTNSSSKSITSHYKKIYEMDRKSLFSPDIIFRSNLPKDSLIDHSLKSENNVINKEKKDNFELDKKSKPRQQFKSQLENLSHKKKMSKNSFNLKMKMVHKASIKTLSKTTKAKNGNKKYKRLKVEVDNCETVINANMNENEGSITKVSETLNTAEIPEVKEEINPLPNTDNLENNSMPDWLKAKCIEHNIRPCYVVLERL